MDVVVMLVTIVGIAEGLRGGGPTAKEASPLQESRKG